MKTFLRTPLSKGIKTLRYHSYTLQLTTAALQFPPYTSWFRHYTSWFRHYTSWLRPSTYSRGPIVIIIINENILEDSTKQRYHNSAVP